MPTDTSHGPDTPTPSDATPADPASADLLRIQEVASEVGLTTRAVRYYEELGLLRPAARSSGAYRLYDRDDVERLRFIRGLRDDAGFSLAEIGRLLEDDDARERNRARFLETTDVDERRAILTDAAGRMDRQIDSLQAKVRRIEAMIDVATKRRRHLKEHLEDLAAGRPHRHRDDTGGASA